MGKKFLEVFCLVIMIISLVSCKKAEGEKAYVNTELETRDMNEENISNIEENTKESIEESTEGKNEGQIKLENYLNKYDEEKRALLIRKMDLGNKNQKKEPLFESPIFGVGFDEDINVNERYKVINLESIDGDLVIKVDSELTEGKISYNIYSPDGVLQENKGIEEEILCDEYIIEDAQLGLWLFEILSEKDTVGKIEFYIYSE